MLRRGVGRARGRPHRGAHNAARRRCPDLAPNLVVAIDERIYVGAPAHTKKVGRVKRDPRVAFLVESGERWAELWAVHLTGRARVVDDEATIARPRAVLDVKYREFRQRRDAMPDASRRYYETERALIEIVPDERVLSWDNVLDAADAMTSTFLPTRRSAVPVSLSCIDPRPATP